MPSGTELSRSSSYQCGKVWNSPLIAVGSKDNPSSVLVVALAAQHPSPQSLQLLEHEYSLTSGVDFGWVAKPLALAHQEGPTILLLKDSGGKPSVRFSCHARQPLGLGPSCRLRRSRAWTISGGFLKYDPILRHWKSGTAFLKRLSTYRSSTSVLPTTPDSDFSDDTSTNHDTAFARSGRT
jgi:hypothetical protein